MLLLVIQLIFLLATQSYNKQVNMKSEAPILTNIMSLYEST